MKRNRGSEDQLGLTYKLLWLAVKTTHRKRFNGMNSISDRTWDAEHLSIAIQSIIMQFIAEIADGTSPPPPASANIIIINASHTAS